MTGKKKTKIIIQHTENKNDKRSNWRKSPFFANVITTEINLAEKCDWDGRDCGASGVVKKGACSSQSPFLSATDISTESRAEFAADAWSLRESRMSEPADLEAMFAQLPLIQTFKLVQMCAHFDFRNTPA
jgi:hypothetical protein